MTSKSSRPPGTPSELFYNTFADEFDRRMNRYDLARRLAIVFEELLPPDIQGMKLLDAGCGTGHFSRAAAGRGAVVTSMDIGEKLLEKVAEKCDSERVCGSVLELPFADASFDIVVSSEVIEHTPEPLRAISEFYRVLKPGGTLALTVPNRAWKWSCIIANALRIRPYEGLENWVGFDELLRALKDTGFTVTQYRGFHLFPFQLRLLEGSLTAADRFGSRFGRFYINIAAGCRK